MGKNEISLCVITKNEEHNLPGLFESFNDVVDEFIICDTGSTDGTVECAKRLGAKVVHFEWIDDFSAARNHSLSFATKEFCFWVDADDRLGGKENFLIWKENVMPLRELWYAKYNYVFDSQNNPIVSFVRERIFKRSLGFQFKDFIHEGIEPITPDGTFIQGELAASWWIDHSKSQERARAGKDRNVSMLERKKDSLNPRLKYYFGKELYDHQRFDESVSVLTEVLKDPNLHVQDRVMAHQYLALGLCATKEFAKAIQYCFLGLHLDPTRAEFFCVIADAFVGQNKIDMAIPFYYGAINCQNAITRSGQSTLFTSNDVYTDYPTRSLAKIFFHKADYEKAISLIKDDQDFEMRMLHLECEKAIQLTKVPSVTQRTIDIVITCPPSGAYKWDSKIYKEKGLGGSETACVEMATHLKKLTNRPVFVFNPREDNYVDEHGVEYKPSIAAFGYFQKYKPAIHIMWRHSVKMTDAPSFVWCHDLITNGAENGANYDKMLCLSEFHKNFVRGSQGIPEDKILLTRNGVEPKRFENLQIKKQYGKVIWPSSPDRGLEYAILIMDRVRKAIPQAELHVFYGMDNLYKFGLEKKADELKEMMSTRPWVINHGNVDQKTLAQEFASSEVWLYPANFIESFCIVALESILAKCWPIVRKMGALPNTLRAFEFKGMANVLDLSLEESDREIWAAHVINAILEQKWQRIEARPEAYSWESVAKEWVQMFQLNLK